MYLAKVGGNSGVVDMAGQRYGRLVIGSYVGYKPGGGMWNCFCDCGAQFIAQGRNIRTGRTKSCGCFKIEKSLRSIKHGEARKGRIAPEHRVWRGMIDRCTNPKSTSYKYYGAIGITVCARWTADYAAFIADMGRRPSAKHSIDRIEVSGNYEPGNCRWATALEQRHNRRDSK